MTDRDIATSPDIEAPVEDALEQRQTLGEPAATESLDPDAPEGDALDQHTPVGRGQYAIRHSLSHEVDEADAAEQSVVVELDEDDYR